MGKNFIKLTNAQTKAQVFVNKDQIVSFTATTYHDNSVTAITTVRDTILAVEALDQVAAEVCS